MMIIHDKKLEELYQEKYEIEEKIRKQKEKIQSDELVRYKKLLSGLNEKCFYIDLDDEDRVVYFQISEGRIYVTSDIGIRIYFSGLLLEYNYLLKTYSIKQIESTLDQMGLSFYPPSTESGEINPIERNCKWISEKTFNSRFKFWLKKLIL